MEAVIDTLDPWYMLERLSSLMPTSPEPSAAWTAFTAMARLPLRRPEPRAGLQLIVEEDELLFELALAAPDRRGPDWDVSAQVPDFDHVAADFTRTASFSTIDGTPSGFHAVTLTCEFELSPALDPVLDTRIWGLGPTSGLDDSVEAIEGHMPLAFEEWVAAVDGSPAWSTARTRGSCTRVFCLEGTAL